MEFEPDANMLFNYMMISALANVADRVEREGGKSSGGRIEIANYIYSSSNVNNLGFIAIFYSLFLLAKRTHSFWFLKP